MLQTGLTEVWGMGTYWQCVRGGGSVMVDDDDIVLCI